MNFLLYRMLFILILSLFGSLIVSATIFVPQSISDQIKDSDSVIQGVFTTKSSKQMANGSIITESNFRLSKALESDHFGLSIVVLTPGGQVGDRVQMIDGTPVFKTGEEVILLLKKSPQGYWINNLALGKYILKEKNGQLFLQSEIFANDPNLNNIPYEKFEKILLDHFKNKFIEVNIPIESTELKSTNILLNSNQSKSILKSNFNESKIDLKILFILFFLTCLSIGIYRWKLRTKE